MRFIKNIKTLHYKELFLYGMYNSYLFITSIATIVDFLIQNYIDALLDFISVILVFFAFKNYLKNKNQEFASVFIFWISSSIVFIFIIKNEFNIGVIFTLLIPLVAFILLSTKKIIQHVSLYFVILTLIFVFGYLKYDTHPLLYDPKPMSAYIIATMFVLAFGFFYHTVIEHYYQELEEANRQKTFLLKEIHHRVKNNLNIIASLLGLQKFETNSQEVHKLIDQNRLRLQSIAMAHEILYKQDNLEHIAFDTYISKLSSHILEIDSYSNTISLKIDIIKIHLSIESVIQFGIIINELMTNSIKYAFENRDGEIIITLIKTINGYQFKYYDSGKGFDIENCEHGFGHNLIEMSIEQLGGILSIKNENGLSYIIDFKELV